jgi:hypothetical protein
VLRRWLSGFRIVCWSRSIGFGRSVGRSVLSLTVCLSLSLSLSLSLLVCLSLSLLVCLSVCSLPSPSHSDIQGSMGFAYEGTTSYIPPCVFPLLLLWVRLSLQTVIENGGQEEDGQGFPSFCGGLPSTCCCRHRHPARWLGVVLLICPLSVA